MRVTIVEHKLELMLGRLNMLQRNALSLGQSSEKTELVELLQHCTDIVLTLQRQCREKERRA